MSRTIIQYEDGSTALVDYPGNVTIGAPSPEVARLDLSHLSDSDWDALRKKHATHDIHLADNQKGFTVRQKKRIIKSSNE